MRKPLLALILTLCSVTTYSQTWDISADSLSYILRHSPSFNVFKDNYFMVGIPTNASPNKYNSNVKYQISFSQRLTNAVLPLNSYLFLTYSQKAFWDIFLDSKPFTEINFNPSIGVATPIFQQNRYKGLLAIMFEHESNGRAGDASRSWNFISATFQSRFSHNWAYNVRLWVPFGYKDDNPDLLKYAGCVEFSASWLPLKNDRLVVDLTARKGCSWDWKGHFKANVAYKITKNSNQYVGAEWYCGHAESLIEYQNFVSMVRIGLVIKPKIVNFK